MSTLITVLHVIVCLFLMLTVLLQSGKGGGMGAAFGGGNAATVFGGSGASGFLKRLTAIAGSIFMVTSMVLAFLSSRNSADSLESFGKKEASIALEKDKAKAEVLRAAKKAKEAGSGSAGSGSAGQGSSSSSMSPPTTVTPDQPGTAGSAVAPSESPIPNGSAAAPVTPTPPKADTTPTTTPKADTTPTTTPKADTTPTTTPKADTTPTTT
ncbi:MAG: preprotein translocase, SecG subunit, partial [Deltaproteobacteria bacterium]|nr:preprotein translocase, SecG subunit [Deltaproteobacteria bacterium]